MAGFELSEPVITKVAAFARDFSPSFPAIESRSLTTSDNRPPSRDELPSHARSAAGTNPDAPARSLFPLFSAQDITHANRG